MPGAIPLVALAFTFGIALGETIAIGRTPALVCATGMAILAGIARVRERGVGGALLGLALALGLVSGTEGRPPPLPGELSEGRRDLQAEVVGLSDRAFGNTTVPVALRAFEREGLWREVAGRVRVSIAGELHEPVLPGDRVRLRARVRLPRGFVNPGGPDAARRAGADRVAAVAGVHDPTGFVPMIDDGRALAGPMRWAARARNHLIACVRRRLSGERRALVASLVVGDRGEVSHELDAAFRDAGVSHVLSVSGLHLAIVAILFYAGLTRLLAALPRLARGTPVRRWAALSAIPATIGYTLVTGAAIATVRACVVAVLGLGAVALGRRVTAVGALALAGIAILAVRPLELFDPSFQLSFSAALATGWLAPRLSSGVEPARWQARAALVVWRLFLVSAAATAVTAPLCAWHFSSLAPCGLVANLVVVPIAELGVVPVGLGGAILDALRLPGGPACLRLAGLFAGILATATRWFARWAPAWSVPAPTGWEAAAWWLACLGAGLRGRAGRRLLLLGVLIVALAVGGRAVARRTGQTLTAIFLDVGQGDAAVLELPGGRVVVIDGGGSFDPAFDPGERVIAPLLRRRGHSRISLLVLSHPHPDHANGLATLVEQFAVEEIWTNGQPTRQPGTLRLLQAAARRGVPVRLPRSLRLGEVTLEPLAPRDQAGLIAAPAGVSANDASLVVEVGYRRRRILFAGDLERAGEAALLSSTSPRHIDVLKVPHHGSRTSSTPAWVERLHPEIAVFSVGVDNRWGFPHREVLVRYRQIGARCVRTDRDGGTEIEIGGDGRLRIRPSRPGALGAKGTAAGDRGCE